MSDKKTQQLPLGQQVTYPQRYSPEVLCPIPRSQGRQEWQKDEALPFGGEDIWTAYEVSWLNLKGKPQVALAECRIPADSPSMVESKSFKLYLNSFNQSRFESAAEVARCAQQDLSALLESDVAFTIYPLDHYEGQALGSLQGVCLDELDIEIDEYSPNRALLSSDKEDIREECLYSHLLKSNCRITSQPDWASVMIRYQGPAIDREALLRYIVGFRNHDEFHEPCVEKIFTDILQQCQPEKLTVYARYTRRGGLDINPFRSNFEAAPENIRLPRQ